MNTFTAGSCIKFGWETFKKRAWFFIGSTALVLCALWILNMLGNGTRDMGLLHLVIALIVYGLSVLIDMGMIAFFLKAHDDASSVKLADLYHARSFWNYLVAVVVVAILTVIGLVLLIVPGVILILMWAFVKFLIVERDIGAFDAMKESARITKGSRLDLLLLMLFAVIINIVGAILLGVGLLVTIPVSLLAVTHAYRMLSAKAGAAALSPAA